ncbi:MAG: phosphatidylglycerophosphatase A, partial [Alphaproteobacteria bacterium]|nr:phosphatidylglycerophosphatase A [Alphaproteobacteria bacterium]
QAHNLKVVGSNPAPATKFPPKFMHKICHIFSTILGVGCLPYAPGTWGSLAGLCVSFLGVAYFSFQPFTLICMSLAVFVLGWISSFYVLEKSSYHDMDPSFIVIDEVAGLFFAIGLVGLFFPLTPWILVGNFLLFRCFDIFKPWPIGWIDKKLAMSQKTAAFGIMLDDMLAGLMAAVVQVIILDVV